MNISDEHFEQLCKIAYKDYGKDETYMQRVNTIKYNKKVTDIIIFLKEQGYFK